MNYQEKRAHQRFTTDLVFIYDIVSCLEDTPELHPMGTAAIRDISLGGARIATYQRLPVGVELSVTLVPFSDHTLKIQTVGCVRWSQQLREDSFDSGIQFVSFTGNSQEILRQYIATLAGGQAV